jgi:hypothetical protein
MLSPKLLEALRQYWRGLEARRQELLPTPYVHVVFTLSRELAPLDLQNKRSFTPCYSEPALKLCSKWPVTQGMWVHRSGSSASCTPGIRNSNIILMSIACCPREVYAQIIAAGSDPFLLLSSRQSIRPRFSRQVYSGSEA